MSEMQGMPASNHFLREDNAWLLECSDLNPIKGTEQVMGQRVFELWMPM